MTTTGVRPRICAHAGCEGLPMDSLEAIEAGIGAGAEVVELDVRFTADGRAVLSHDPVVLRPDGRLYTLEEALRLLASFPQVEINVDVKEPGPLASFSTPITRGEVVNPLYCTGLKAHQLPAFRKGCPHLAHTVDDLPWWFAFGSKTARVDVLKRYRDAGVLALNLSYHLVDEALMETSRLAGFPVRVWTADDPAVMRRMIGLGVESITTNRVSVLRELVR